MLEIHEAKNISEYNRITESLPAGKEYKIIESYSREGEITGYGIYSFENDCTVIYDCGFGSDTALCDGILRTILFKALLSGVDKGRCEAEYEGINLFDFMKYPNTDHMIESIDDFLNSCKKCKEM